VLVAAVGLLLIIMAAVAMSLPQYSLQYRWQYRWMQRHHQRR
jgi:hypothetical protein